MHPVEAASKLVLAPEAVWKLQPQLVLQVVCCVHCVGTVFLPVQFGGGTQGDQRLRQMPGMR